MKDPGATVLDGEAFLQAFHHRHPGCTSRAFGNVRPGETSSYARLAAVVPNESTTPLKILDLACGDGYLLATLADRRQDRLRLVGADMSATELAAGKQRVSDSDVRWLHERAQALSLRDGSIDYVLSHMALMLMHPIVDVLDEVRRILRPGGMLAAVLPGGHAPSGAYATFIHHLRQVLPPERRLPNLGDERFRSDAETRSLLETAGFIDVSDQAFSVELICASTELWAFFTEMYTLAFLSAVEADRLRQLTVESCRDWIHADGYVHLPWHFRLLRTRKPL